MFEWDIVCVVSDRWQKEIFKRYMEVPIEAVENEKNIETEINSELAQGLIWKLMTPLVFLIASLIIYSALQCYPVTVAFLLSFMLAILAYRWPDIALVLTLGFTAVAFSYQIDASLTVLGITLSIALTLPFIIRNFSGAIQCCLVGVTAGVLMLTPYYLFSLPLIAGVALFRDKAEAVSRGVAVVMFVVLYFPLLFLQQAATQISALPLFMRIEYLQQPRLEQLSFESVKTALQSHPASTAGETLSFSEYFVQEWCGIALVLILLLAIVATPALFKRLARRAESTEVFNKIRPLLLVLSIEVVFLVSLLIFKSTLGYITGFDGLGDIASLTGICLLVGCIGSGIEIWMYRRGCKSDLESELSAILVEIGDLMDSNRAFVKQVSEICQSIDLRDEKLALSEYEEKISLSKENMERPRFRQLNVARNELFYIRLKLQSMQQRIESKLSDYLNRSRNDLEDAVEGSRDLGLIIPRESIDHLLLSKEQGYETTIAAQGQINDTIKELAHQLVAAGDVVATAIKTEFDHQFSLPTVDISHGFLEQGRFEEAVRTILEDLRVNDGRLEGSIVELGNQVAAVAGRFQEILDRKILSMAELIGESESLSKCYNIAHEFKAIAESIKDSGTLADLISIDLASQKIAEQSMIIVVELKNEINDIKEDNDNRCPARYSWESSNPAARKVQEFLDTTDFASSELTISDRLKIAEQAINIIEKQTEIVEKYSRTNEFFMNYPVMEHIIEEKLKTNKGIDSTELPTDPGYGLEYLMMYTAQNFNEITLDPRTGAFKRKLRRRTS